MSNNVKQKGKNEKPPEVSTVNRDIGVSNFGFLDELPNPNDFWLDGVHGNLSDPLGGYDAIEIMDRTCPPIPETFAIIESITGLETILLGDEKSDQYKIVDDSFENLENINTILRRTLEAIKAGMIVNQIIYDPTITKQYWLLKDILDYHQSRFRFSANNELEMWDDSQWIGVDETLSFKVGSYATKYGNRYGFGLANFYYWPFQFYVGGAKRWAGFQDGLGSPSSLIMPGSETATIDPKTQEKLENWIANKKAGDSFFSPDFLKLMIVESTKDSNGDHLNFIGYWAKQIAMIMIGSASHLQDRSTGTFAEEKVHQQIRRDLLLNYIEWLEDYVNNQVIKTLVNVNFGPQEREKYPKWKVVVPETADEETRERVRLAWEMGLPLSHAHAYDILGLPIPEDGDTKLLTAPAKEIPFSTKYKDMLILDLKGLSG